MNSSSVAWTPFAGVLRRCARMSGLLILLTGSGMFSARADGASPVLDDYSDATRNRNGVERLLIDDRTAGGKSQATQHCENGQLEMRGTLAPGRGVPAFISLVSPLSRDGAPRDLSAYQGVRLRVKVTQGLLCVQVSSTGITNFDYHTSAPIPGGRGEFQEVRIPFKDMKRAWSEPLPLNLKTVTSVNLVSFGMARDSFAYTVDELGFY